METADREIILRKIAEVEQQISRLQKQREEAERMFISLREQLARSNGDTHKTKHSVDLSVSTATNLTPEDKVALFLRLFRGRADVYRKLWQNRTTGKQGYSPACTNERVRGLCEKPRVKCGECRNQAFPPVTTEVICDHLRGRHVISVYPMLKDKTCWFLAADFDSSFTVTILFFWYFSKLQTLERGLALRSALFGDRKG